MEFGDKKAEWEELWRRWAECLRHEFRDDGESKITPGRVRSEVCIYCGIRRAPGGPERPERQGPEQD